MNEPSILEHNRVILCHFDSYSTALLFARYGNSVLAPEPLPEGACAMPEPPKEIGRLHDPGAALDALAARQGLDLAAMTLADDFQAWMTTADGPVRVHLARFTALDAPRATIERLGGIFKPISDMRGTPMIELNLMRQVFNLILGGA